LPLIAYRRRQDGSRERYSGLIADLLQSPAPSVTQANLIGQAVAHLNLWGNCFVGKWRDPDGRIIRLALLPPDRVQVELKRDVPRYTLTDYQGRQSEHGTSDILHIRALSTDGLVGLSPVSLCRISLGLSSSLTRHAAQFFENDARPGGIVQLPPGTSEEGLERFYEGFYNKHGTGHGRAHSIGVLEGEAKWIPVSMPLDDAQFLEQRKLSATEIARIFRVPAWVISAEDSAGSGTIRYQNVSQQMEAFHKTSLLPWLTVIEQAFTQDKDLSPQSVYVEFLLDNLLRADHKTRHETYATGIDKGYYTVNEVRRFENLPPLEEVTVARPSAAAIVANGGTENE
jgi:HK97 family phage portal protein